MSVAALLLVPSCLAHPRSLLLNQAQLRRLIFNLRPRRRLQRPKLPSFYSLPSLDNACHRQPSRFRRLRFGPPGHCSYQQLRLLHLGLEHGLLDVCLHRCFQLHHCFGERGTSALARFASRTWLTEPVSRSPSSLPTRRSSSPRLTPPLALPRSTLHLPDGPLARATKST